MTEIILNTTFIFLLLLPYSCQVIINVDSCPSNEQSWKQRSSAFLCQNPHEVYHCIKCNDQTLIETCMIPYNISSFKVGCPWVQVIDRKAFLGNPFNPCNPMHSGCPQRSHKKYLTNQLHIFPACIKPGNITRIDETRSFTFLNPWINTTTVTGIPTCTTTKEEGKCHLIVGPVILSNVVIMLPVLLICIWKYKRNGFDHRPQAIEGKRRKCHCTEIEEASPILPNTTTTFVIDGQQRLSTSSDTSDDIYGEQCTSTSSDTSADKEKQELRQRQKHMKEIIENGDKRNVPLHSSWPIQRMST